MDVWKNRLSNYLNDITIQYFKKGKDAIDFIKLHKEKNNIFLLADYELRDQWINGIDVINLSGTHRTSMFVTNNYNDEKLRYFAGKHSVKILPKQALFDVSIQILP
jgi:hypothetical protein